MKTKVIYYLLPIIVLLGSIVGREIWLNLDAAAFKDIMSSDLWLADKIERILVSTAFIVILMFSVSYCIAKFVKQKERISSETLFDKIETCFILTIAINYIYLSLCWIVDALFIFTIGYLFTVIISYIACYVWLRKVLEQ